MEQNKEMTAHESLQLISEMLNGLGFGLGLADAGLSLTFRMQDGLLLLGIGAVDDGRLLTLGSQNLGSLLTF